MFSFVVAIAKNNVIGREQGLAWHLPSDARYFKEITQTGSKTMIMGRKTFESLPKVLPGRRHIILTSEMDYKADDENVQIAHSLNDIMHFACTTEEYFVIGGAQIFNMLFPYTERMYITEIHEDFEGDTYFPPYDKSEWKVTAAKAGIVDEKNKYKHTFLILERRLCK